LFLWTSASRPCSGRGLQHLLVLPVRIVGGGEPRNAVPGADGPQVVFNVAARSSNSAAHIQRSRCAAGGAAEGGPVKRTAADARWSDIVRARDGWKCQRCGKYYAPPTRALHAAHLFSRGRRRTRTEPDAGVAACYGCHRYLDAHPDERKALGIEKIGKRRYDELEKRSRIPAKVAATERD
jgi:hypothetical protein